MRGENESFVAVRRCPGIDANLTDPLRRGEMSAYVPSEILDGFLLLGNIPQL
jgi:hypothetical protein